MKEKLKILETGNKSIKDLKKGDEVSFYGGKFKILENAKVLDEFDRSNSVFWVYTAKCKRIDNLKLGDIDGLLTSLVHFKGTDSVKYAVIK